MLNSKVFANRMEVGFVRYEIVSVLKGKLDPINALSCQSGSNMLFYMFSEAHATEFYQ